MRILVSATGNFNILHLFRLQIMTLARRPLGIFRTGTCSTRFRIFIEKFVLQNGFVVESWQKKHRPVLETTCYGCTQCLLSCIWFWRSFCWDATHHKSKPGPERRWVTDCLKTASLHTVLWHKLCPKYFYFKLFFMYTPFGWSHLWGTKGNHSLTGRQCLAVNAYLCLFLTDLFLCL